MKKKNNIKEQKKNQNELKHLSSKLGDHKGPHIEGTDFKIWSPGNLRAHKGFHLRLKNVIWLSMFERCKWNCSWTWMRHFWMGTYSAFGTFESLGTCLYKRPEKALPCFFLSFVIFFSQSLFLSWSGGGEILSFPDLAVELRCACLHPSRLMRAGHKHWHSGVFLSTACAASPFCTWQCLVTKRTLQWGIPDSWMTTSR